MSAQDIESNELPAIRSRFEDASQSRHEFPDFLWLATQAMCVIARRHLPFRATTRPPMEGEPSNSVQKKFYLSLAFFLFFFFGGGGPIYCVEVVFTYVSLAVVSARQPEHPSKEQRKYSKTMRYSDGGGDEDEGVRRCKRSRVKRDIVRD